MIGQTIISRPGGYSYHRAVGSKWKGIDADTLASAGVEVDADGTARIPYFNADESLHATRTHLPGPGGGWRWPPRTTLIPFGLETIPFGSIKETDILFVCEGESDTLAIREHIASIDGRRVYALGLPGAATWRPEWKEYVEDFAAIYITFDADEAGWKASWKVKHSIPWARLVRLPDGDDVRRLVQRDGAEALLAFMDDATFDLKLDIGFRRCQTLDEVRELLDKEVL